MNRITCKKPIAVPVRPLRMMYLKVVYVNNSSLRKSDVDY